MSSPGSRAYYRSFQTPRLCCVRRTSRTSSPGRGPRSFSRASVIAEYWAWSPWCISGSLRVVELESRAWSWTTLHEGGASGACCVRQRLTKPLIVERTQSILRPLIREAPRTPCTNEWAFNFERAMCTGAHCRVRPATRCRPPHRRRTNTPVAQLEARLSDWTEILELSP
jgi:hypothetical protein